VLGADDARSRVSEFLDLGAKANLLLEEKSAAGKGETHNRLAMSDLAFDHTRSLPRFRFL
jgi:hypothetical protein